MRGDVNWRASISPVRAEITAEIHQGEGQQPVCHPGLDLKGRPEELKYLGHKCLKICHGSDPLGARRTPAK